MTIKTILIHEMKIHLNDKIGIDLLINYINYIETLITL